MTTISNDGVPTCLRCDRIFNNKLITDLVSSLTVKVF